jgi:hypothetical protein
MPLPEDTHAETAPVDDESPPMEPAMLDVHPPHQAIHGWRDFFIHIATIVVGLLIAVALEQTVEACWRRPKFDPPLTVLPTEI